MYLVIALRDIRLHTLMKMIKFKRPVGEKTLWYYGYMVISYLLFVLAQHRHVFIN